MPGLTAAEVRDLYRLDGLTVPGPGGTAAPADGRGQVIAIINAGGVSPGYQGSITLESAGVADNATAFADSPVFKFSATNSLTQFGNFDPALQTPFYLIVGPEGTTSSAWFAGEKNGEFDLDIAEAHTAAPGASVIQVMLAQDDFNYAHGVDIAQSVAQRLQVPLNVVSLSYGFQEPVPNQSQPWNGGAPNSTVITDFTQAVNQATDVTFSIAAGDSGGGYQQLLDGKTGQPVSPAVYGYTTMNALAALPNVVAAGGTYLDGGQYQSWSQAGGWGQPGAVTPEQAWGHDQASGIDRVTSDVVNTGGGGGGVSLLNPGGSAQQTYLATRATPSVPTDFAAYFQDVVPSGQLPDPPVTPQPNARLGPDVALLASPAAAGGDGTSAAAPKFAGLVAVANQARAARGLAPLGSEALSVLYRAPATAFNDVTLGQPRGDGTGYAGNGFPVGPGFDLATGRGSPNAAALVPWLGGQTFTAFYAVGSGPGGAPNVAVHDSRTNALLFSFMPYGPDFGGGVAVASADLNGDGVPELISGAGPGGGPDVKVFDGQSLLATHGSAPVMLANFFAYDRNFAGGVAVAAGDVNGDGVADVVTGAGPGGGPDVKVFSGAGLVAGRPAALVFFFPYAKDFTGGVTVAAGDVNGDGYADLVTGAGAGGGPDVKVFDGRGLAAVTFHVLANFFAYDPHFAGGVRVAAGDVNGDGFADLVTGAGAGGGPHVMIFDGRTEHVLDSFFAHDAHFVGGVAVALRDTDGDGASDELLTAASLQNQPQLRVRTDLLGSPQVAFDLDLDTSVLGDLGLSLG